MDFCTQCGAALGVGRFCTNCGHPVAEADAAAESWRTDTAERPRVTVPPPVPSMPEPARFPLYADDAQRADEERTLWFPEEPATKPPPRHRGDHRWLPWVLGFVVLALVAGFGGWLLFGGEDEPLLAQDPQASSSPDEDGAASSPEPGPEPTRTRQAPPPESPGEPTELAPTAEVSAPAAAPPSEDASGNTVLFVAPHMLDGVAETTWRMPGDGTGETITFSFDSPAVLSEVGLVNGYAKVGQDAGGLLDWYAGNRRIFKVEWAFDDGTVVTQRLSETASMQTIPVDDVETESATLRLLKVSAPGTGRASRDYTAISDVSLVGTGLS